MLANLILGSAIYNTPRENRGEFGDCMNEEKFVTKSCPSCFREIPTFWDSCQFCGNVFRKTEHSSDEPAMLCWGKGKKKARDPEA